MHFQIFRFSDWGGAALRFGGPVLRPLARERLWRAIWRNRSESTRSNRSTAGLSDIFRFFRYFVSREERKGKLGQRAGAAEKNARVRYGREVQAIGDVPGEAVGFESGSKLPQSKRFARVGGAFTVGGEFPIEGCLEDRWGSEGYEEIFRCFVSREERKGKLG